MDKAILPVICFGLMSDSDQGWGCAVIIIGIICLAAYPFYDGYASRKLPPQEAAKVSTEASLNRFGEHPDAWVTISNNSEWVVDAKSVTVSLIADGKVPVSSEGHLEQDNTQSPDVMPGDKATYHYHLIPVAERLIASEGQIRVMAKADSGHRRPIKLAKSLVDSAMGAWRWLVGLFERS